MARSGQTRLRTTATVAGTVLVVVLEMALLTGVWHLGDSLDHQREAAATLSGTLRPLTPATAPEATERVRAAVLALGAAGVDVTPGTPGGTVVESADALLTNPSSSPALDAVRAADTALRADLEQATSTRAWTAFAIHATLLVLVSIGWFAWFRRLVDRHRAVERHLTAQRVVDLRERRLLALVQNSADLVVVIEDDGVVSFASPSARSVLGRPAAELVGQHVVGLLREDAPTLIGMLAAGRTGDLAVSFRLVHADGREIVADGTLSNLLEEAAVGAWVLTLRDVTEQHALAEQLVHQAFHDSLTGLANRALFADRLDHAVSRRDGSIAVLVLDLDDYKHVNDTHGRLVGDQLLVAVSDRLRGALRPGDTAARLGGDEFAVLMEQTDRAAAESAAHRVLDALRATIEVDGVSWSASASIGIALTDPAGATGESVLRDADIAMYWAKEKGKGTIRVFDADRHAATLDRMSIQTDLVTAIDRDELELHYQPIVDLRTRVVTGFEALVRWQHPDRGGLAPGQFVPGAERSGLVVALGSWALREACRAACELQVSRPGVTMSVNVSAQQLVRPGFVDEVARALDDTGLPPALLVLEITESVLLDDVDTAMTALHGLRELGTRTAIDDFGTGYSSLSYLARLPVDILKVDKSFVDGVIAEEHAATVALAILEMGRSLRLTMVAEGVESVEQAAWLEEHGCDRGQGYLWSRALPLAEAHLLLERPGTAAEDGWALSLSSP